MRLPWIFTPRMLYENPLPCYTPLILYGYKKSYCVRWAVPLDLLPPPLRRPFFYARHLHMGKVCIFLGFSVLSPKSHLIPHHVFFLLFFPIIIREKGDMANLLPAHPPPFRTHGSFSLLVSIRTPLYMRFPESIWTSVCVGAQFLPMNLLWLYTTSALVNYSLFMSSHFSLPLSNFVAHIKK